MTSERAAWVQLVVLAISIAAFVFVSYADDAKQRSVYEEGRQAGLAEARRAARADEVRQHQAIDRVRHECEEECDDRLVRQRGLLVEQIEECQGELAVSRINERR
jgi:hypothetical protein